MATFIRSDLWGLFILLAVAYLFDSIPSGFLLPMGVFGFLILLAAVWASSNDYGEPLKEFIKDIDPEIIFRIALVVIFVGILLLSQYVVIAGLLIGTLLLFVKGDVFTINFIRLELSIRSIGKNK